jgi:TPR repeat protein
MEKKHGLHIPSEDHKAFPYLAQALKGDAEQQYQVGMALKGTPYVDGGVCPHRQWLLLAAARNHPGAQFSLSLDHMCCKVAKSSWMDHLKIESAMRAAAQAHQGAQLRHACTLLKSATMVRRPRPPTWRAYDPKTPEAEEAARTFQDLAKAGVAAAAINAAFMRMANLESRARKRRVEGLPEEEETSNDKADQDAHDDEAGDASSDDEPDEDDLLAAKESDALLTQALKSSDPRVVRVAWFNQGLLWEEGWLTVEGDSTHRTMGLKRAEECYLKAAEHDFGPALIRLALLEDLDAVIAAAWTRDDSDEMRGKKVSAKARDYYTRAANLSPPCPYGKLHYGQLIRYQRIDVPSPSPSPSADPVSDDEVEGPDGGDASTRVQAAVVPTSDQAAFAYILEAALLGLPVAEYKAGEMCRKGVGVLRSPSLAAHFYLKGHEQGVFMSYRRLEDLVDDQAISSEFRPLPWHSDAQMPSPDVPIYAPSSLPGWQFVDAMDERVCESAVSFP